MCNGFPHQDLVEDVRLALKDWHKESAVSSPIEYLYLFRKTLREEACNARQATNQVIFDALKKLEGENELHARVLHLRFLNKETVYATANMLNLAEATVYERQREAIRHLAQLLQEMESDAQKRQQQMLEDRLDPATYINLIGVEAHLEQLMSKLTPAGAP
ncbi:hypothetical protein KFU94_01040 [Chloroflexi bacterium TSY]|nr:hypothetical protein [Chloroflexi bacterium TSY]